MSTASAVSTTPAPTVLTCPNCPSCSCKTPKTASGVLIAILTLFGLFGMYYGYSQKNNAGYLIGSYSIILAIIIGALIASSNFCQ